MPLSQRMALCQGLMRIEIRPCLLTARELVPIDVQNMRVVPQLASPQRLKICMGSLRNARIMRPKKSWCNVMQWTVPCPSPLPGPLLNRARLKGGTKCGPSAI